MLDRDFRLALETILITTNKKFKKYVYKLLLLLLSLKKEKN